MKALQKTAHIGHCTHTVESADVKVQNIFQGRNNVTCSIDCEHRAAATVYTVGTWFVLGISLQIPCIKMVTRIIIIIIIIITSRSATVSIFKY